MDDYEARGNDPIKLKKETKKRRNNAITLR